MPSDDPSAGALSRVDLSDDHYTVVQSLVRNRYEARDSAGTVVLRGKQKLFKMKEEFPFETADGTDAFTVKAASILDIAGSYVLTDAGTGEDVIVLDRDFTLFVDTWTLRDPDTGSVIATIESSSKLIALLRHVSGLAGLVPHSYTISTPDGTQIGSIDGQFSVKDTYEVSVSDSADVPREAVVAAAMVIDAIEAN